MREAKGQIGFYYTTELYHSILDLHGLRHVGEACRAALRKFDTKAMAEAIPDSLVDEIAIACTPDEALDRLAQWRGLTEDPLFYPPSVGVRPASKRFQIAMPRSRLLFGIHTSSSGMSGCGGRKLIAKVGQRGSGWSKNPSCCRRRSRSSSGSTPR